ncbi:MAG: Stp1/IreP family PP2C-type Ser/Thr phosphatase [Lachnospiraceae bacterium]|nr:Stp1/IreP family PP2C-type Ser/Thr phosphatase [Lachnospiraceae bacterium]
MKSYSVTDKGKTREINQDYIYGSDEPVGPLPNLYIVADGMGGYNAGDYASRCCVEEMVASLQKSEQPTVISSLTEALRAANEAIAKQAAENSELSGMGTTLVAATVFPDKVYAMNVGDSRLYLIGKDIKQITVDHSYVEEMIRKGELLRKDARIHPKKNVITRAVGVEHAVEADFYEIIPESDTKFLLLCSDGLTNMVDDEEIRHILVKHAEKPAVAIETLVARANECGGKDNISAIVIEMKQDSN